MTIDQLKSEIEAYKRIVKTITAPDTLSRWERRLAEMEAELATAMSRPVLAWLDLETTGLNPAVDEILEVALVVVDGGRTVYEGEWLVQSNGVWMCDVVHAMHTKSGLLADPHPRLPLRDVAEDLCIALCGYDRPVLAGSSVHFDRAFLRYHMPRVDALLSHRHYDVSVFHRAAEFWCPARKMPTGEPAHRAMADVRHSMAVEQYYRGVFAP